MNRPLASLNHFILWLSTSSIKLVLWVICFFLGCYLIILSRYPQIAMVPIHWGQLPKDTKDFNYHWELSPNFLNQIEAINTFKFNLLNAYYSSLANTPHILDWRVQLFIGLLGFFLLSISVIFMMVKNWKDKHNKSLVFTDPKTIINLEQLEKSLQSSLDIISGIRHSKVKIKKTFFGEKVFCFADIKIEEGVHIPQMERGVISLLRKRFKDLLMGLPVDMIAKVNITVIPDVNYTVYSINTDLSYNQNINNIRHETNFPPPSNVIDQTSGNNRK